MLWQRRGDGVQRRRKVRGVLWSRCHAVRERCRLLPKLHVLAGDDAVLQSDFTAVPAAAAPNVRAALRTQRATGVHAAVLQLGGRRGHQRGVLLAHARHACHLERRLLHAERRVQRNVLDVPRARSGGDEKPPVLRRARSAQRGLRHVRCRWGPGLRWQREHQHELLRRERVLPDGGIQSVLLSRYPDRRQQLWRVRDAMPRNGRRDGLLRERALPVPVPSGYVQCGSGTGATCVMESAQNCETCGRVCVAGMPLCISGHCHDTCVSPARLCGTTCSNTSTDSSNCGRCGLVRPANTACFSGTCRDTCLSAGVIGCSGAGALPCCAGLVCDASGACQGPDAGTASGDASSGNVQPCQPCVSSDLCSTTVGNVMCPAAGVCPNSDGTACTTAMDAGAGG